MNYHLLNAYSFSMKKREKLIKQVLQGKKQKLLPRVSVLRLGNVIGKSPGQRADGLVGNLFRDAYTSGFLQVEDHNSVLSFLTLEDLGRAFEKILSIPIDHLKHFNLWNISTFDASVLKVASTVASITGARIASPPYGSPSSLPDHRFIPYTNLTPFDGQTLDVTSFERAFQFSFSKGPSPLHGVMEEFDRNIPDIILPKGPHAVKSGEIRQPCPICGASGQQTVIDLGFQPLASDFTEGRDSSMALPRFPLKLVKCRTCNHYHLSHLVNRSELLKHYPYQSGTGSSLSNYSEWLAAKVVQESNLNGVAGSILELACNDGSRLDHFKQHGWSTYGVEAADNLVEIAKQKGHSARSGFWPLSFPELPEGHALTAITAQDVLAHVTDVVAFLKGCANVMGALTRLYVKTSQCNMQQLGQFYTISHDRFSFFTGHSFLKACELAGLEITSFETTPIHGESCLVTMRLTTEEKDPTDISPTLQARLELEEKEGVTNDFLAMKFESKAKATRDWIKSELIAFKSKDFHVGGYGKAAKGIVFLNFMLDGKSDGTELLDFVIDDGPLKQDTYCPGTRIPVRRNDWLAELAPDKPLVLIVFASDSLEEIAFRANITFQGVRGEIFFLVPFLTPKLVRLDVANPDGALVTLRMMPFHPTLIPNPLRKRTRIKTLLITHQRNEKMLMPFFIIHHASMFDEAILIDYDSDDETVSIIEKFAPETWKVVASKHGRVFDIAGSDKEVMSIEKEYPLHWTIALTTTEFLVGASLRLRLVQETGQPTLVKLPIFQVGGNDSKPLVYFDSLPCQRSLGHAQPREENPHRFLHYKTADSYRYSPGRHKYKGKGAIKMKLPDFFIMKYFLSPWPESIPRKMNIGKQLTQSDIMKGWAFHHVDQMNITKLIANRRAFLQSENHDLRYGNLTEIKESKYLSWSRGFHHTLGHCN